MPTPTFNLDNKEIIFENIEELSISSKINLFISYNDSLISFKIVDSNDFPSKEYELLTNLDELGKINNYFRMFNNLNEIQKGLINEYKNKRISFNFLENSVIMTISNLILNNSFEISIPKKDKPFDIKEIYSIITEMKKKIEFLENENKELKNQMRENNKKVEERINNLEILIFQPQIKIQNGPFNKYFENSDIIKNENDINLLLNFLPKNPKQTSLLFNSNIDGDTLESLHNKIDNKSPTYMIIETDKKRIFGGYTTHLWSIKNNKQSYDKNAFVFSLNNKKKYNIIKYDNAIVERKSYIQFGTNCFKLLDEFTSNINIERDSDYETSKNCLTGSEKFRVKSLEVHLIEYD